MAYTRKTSASAVTPTPTTAPYIGKIEEKSAPAKFEMVTIKECHLEGRVAELEARVELLLKVLKQTPGLNIDKLSDGKL